MGITITKRQELGKGNLIANDNHEIHEIYENVRATGKTSPAL